MDRFLWRCVLLGAVLAVCGLTTPRSGGAQQPDSARGPRFLLASSTAASGTVPVDVGRTPVLRQRIALDLDGVSVKEALAEITRRAGLDLAYTADVLPAQGRVRLRAEEITVAAALTDVLVDANVDIVFLREGRAVLRRRLGAEAVQHGTIAGRVTDAAGGAALVGAEVRVVGTQLEAATDDSGRYVLRVVPAGEQRVMARRIGYEAQTRTVSVPDGGRARVDFLLKAVATRLDELVTTVTGDQRRLEVGNSVASIDADSLMQRAPVMSFGDLIQGRAPGVLSMTTGATVGEAGVIRIRGLNSFGVANDPIVVVDGVRVEASAGGGSSGTDLVGANSPRAGGFTGRLADLEPSEIASVEVVKGPSAATLYGTDAANGVLVITTKRGQAGRTRVTAFTEQGVLQQRLDDWGAPYGGAPYYAFGHSTTTGEPQRCTLLQRAASSCVLDSLVSFNAFEHPDTRPYKDGWRQQYGLQVSGGTAAGMTYFLSGDYEQETGTQHMPPADQAFLRERRGTSELPDWQIRPNAYDRVNLRGNFTAPLGRRGSVTLATGFVANQSRRPAGGVPNYQVGYRDQNDGWTLLGGVRPAYVYSWHGEDVVRRFLGSLASTYQVAEWLTLRGTVGADLSTNTYSSLIRQGDGDPAFDIGVRDVNELDVARYSFDLGATATHALSAALSSKTSAGVQYNRRAQRGVRIVATGLPLGGETIAGATDLTSFGGPPSEVTLTTAVAGGYVEQMFGVRDRLFLTGALRFDGGSAFGQDFDAAVYPKAHLSWVVTDGQAGPRLPGVSTLRLRAAYGASGVQPGPTAALQQVLVTPGASGTTAVPAALLGQAGNPELKPERTSELEAGLDLELASGRVRLEFTAYQRTSDDALVSRPLPPSVGGGARWENLGSVRNRGLELLLSADVLRSRTLAAGLTVTGALNQNRLLELGEGVVVSALFDDIRHEVGYPIHGWWGQTVESFADANANGIIEPGEVTVTEPHFIGSTLPTREATAAPYVSLWGDRLRFSGLFQYRGGSHVTDFTGLLNCRSFRGGCRAANDISTPLAEQARAVAATQLFAFGDYTEPASYLLLRELSAGLTLPATWSRALGAGEARLMLAARNVAVLSRQGSGTAPESAVDNGERERSLTGPAGPPTYWLLRLHLNY